MALLEKDVLDETTEDLVGDPEVDAHDDARDEDDDGALHNLLLPGPLDLLELAPRLADEASAGKLARRGAVGAGGLDGRPVPSVPGWPVWRMRSTSPCESGTGFAPAPTKPVTPGVFFTTVQASSFRSMFTST